MGDHLDVSSIRYGIDVPQFNYYGVHTVGNEFDEDMLMTIGKKQEEEYNYELHNTFHNKEGDLKDQVTE